MPLPSTIVNVGTARRRFAVVMSGMIGGGFSDAADADCGVAVARDAIANGAAKADWIIFRLRSLEDCNSFAEGTPDFVVYSSIFLSALPETETESLRLFDVSASRLENEDGGENETTSAGVDINASESIISGVNSMIGGYWG